MRYLLSILCGLLLVGSAFAALTITEDAAPVSGPVNTDPVIDAQWDILLDLAAETVCIDNQLLGCAFADGKFFITGGHNNTAINQLYILSATGAMLDSLDQPTTSAWGWRDLAYDGTYLYAGDEGTVIHAINPVDGSLVPSMNVPRPAGATCTRALAHDPVSDHFWTGNFSSNNYIEFTRTGAVVWSGAYPAGTTGTYGFAWQTVEAGGPFLWIFDQIGTPQTTLKQYNTTTHALTGVTHVVPLLTGLTAQIAGGLEYTSEYNPTLWTFVGLVQGTLIDRAFVMEHVPAGGVTPPNCTITMTPSGSTTIPALGGSFDYNGTVGNLDTTPLTFDVWTKAQLPNGTLYGPALGPVSLTLPGSGTITRLRTQSVPGSAPGGDYLYIGYVGLYPAVISDSSFFPFNKLFVGGSGSYVGEWSNTGESYQSGVGLSVPTGFALQGNYPNPFNPSTTISYSLGNSDVVTLSVYDLSGREVATLVNGYRAAGTHQVTFDAANLASGAYIYKLTAGNQTASAKMILMK